MTPKNEIYAGFYDVKSYEDLEDEMEQSIELKKHFLMLPLAVFIFALLLGKLNWF